MCNRSRALLNEAESRLLMELRNAVQGYPVDVVIKVRLADALDLGQSGLPDDLFNYGTRAHLDFVVIDRATTQSLFAVEYDGAGHFTQPATIVLDRKKSEICTRLKFDLLRITKCHLEPTFLGRSQLYLLVEAWFKDRGMVVAAAASTFLFA